jgi:elongation factor G
MKDYSAKNIRNIGIFGHGGEGKTTITEAMLFNAGLLDRMGRVEDGNTATDYDPEEIKRKISISTALAPYEWNDVKVNLIDSPGYFDFYGEVESAMALADSALIVVGAVSGPVVGTEKAMDMCKRYKKPRMMVINQMDRENANFTKVMDALKEKFGTSLAPIQLPIIDGGAFKGFVDLIEMNAKMFDGKSVKISSIPASLEGAAKELRSVLIEAAAESDEALLEKFFMEEELTKEEILFGLSKGVSSANVTPICCSSASLNLGITTLMDNLVSFMPAADSAPVRNAVDVKTGQPVQVKRDGKLAAQVMKTVADQFSGKISVIKVFAGALSADVSPYNANSEKSEKSGTVYIMRGKNLINTDKLIAGDIGAMTKFQYTNTGDTLCDASAPVKFEEIHFPHPCLGLALSAKKQGEEDKVFGGLNRLLEEDRTLSMEKNSETGDILISGLGEMHLDVVCAKIRNKFKVEAELSEPRIPYRETIRSTAEAEGKHKKQSGGAGQFGVVQMRFEPLPDGDFEFVNAIVGGVVPREFIPAVEKGTREAMLHGVLAGYPMTGVRATLFDGKYHPVDSKEVAFKSAARLSYKAACAKASPMLIEPIYRITVEVPGDYMGDVIGDLNRRRGRVLGMNPTDDGRQEVVAEVPLSELYRYATDLRSMTQARGSFRMEYVRYEDVPGNVAQKIIEQAKKEEEEEE